MTVIHKVAPIASSGRIETLDILRGFAIFGIFMVNVEIMNCIFMNSDSYSEQWTGSLEKLMIRVLQLFFYAKFFPIFSLLFGIGISIQLKSMLKKGMSSTFFFRRMSALFIFGVAHILFLWSGDVIHLYALLGLLTLLFVRLKTVWLLIISVTLLLFPFYNYIFEFLQEVTGYRSDYFLSVYTPDAIRHTIRSGTYLEGVVLRMREYGSNLSILYVYLMPVALAMFLLGLFMGKKGYLKNIPYWTQQSKKPVLVIAVLSNIYRVFFLFHIWETELWKDAFWRELFIYVMQICDTMMALFYVWLIAYACQFSFWKSIFNPLKYVGRMALTNYIIHSVIGLYLFSSLGFSLYETLSPVHTTLLAVLVFVCQIITSMLWLTYFRFGPLEWLWRCISYWKLLPLKK